MTWNIRLNLASDGPNAWPHRRDAVASLVRFHEADVFAVQEALPEQLNDLDARLPQFARFGEGRDADRSGEHTAIFYRQSRFALLGQETFWLSERPDIAGSKGWDAAYPRIVTRGRLRDRITGRTFHLFNTHFDHAGAAARRESARLLSSRIAALREPIVVTGDLNDVPSSEPLAILQAAGLRDALTPSHHGPHSTWNGFKGIDPGRRIDFILLRGPIEVLRHGILAEILEDGRFPSDHLPVFAEVRIGE
jgi:endonuclease/exonuclease/phosphatase family metal-dependent hydrolase